MMRAIRNLTETYQNSYPIAASLSKSQILSFEKRTKKAELKRYPTGFIEECSIPIAIVINYTSFVDSNREG